MTPVDLPSDMSSGQHCAQPKCYMLVQVGWLVAVAYLDTSILVGQCDGESLQVLCP